ncbi:SDR family oxidoreductase [Sporobolomyces salmoneus]|uniref:SDR family oxidoreductase n=1 Tax=Sporobolomyces salmoneus TaxID=183962 RepID=UPI00317BD9B6
MSQPLPKFSAPLVPTHRSDVYDRIDSSSTLSSAATSVTGVLVTGSGRGVGRSTAVAFARAGAKKLVLTSRTKAELEEVKKEIEGLGKGTEVRIVEVDLTKEESVDHLFKEAGEIDVLVNNAGYLEPCVSIRDSKPADWIRTQDINTTGTYLATRAFLRQMPSNAGDNGKKYTVINTSSIGSVGTRPGFSGYQPGKTLINRFSEFLHFEEPSVRTFAIHPGGVMTKLAKDSMPPDTHGMLSDTPELAANFSLWLATDEKADFLRGKYVSANWDIEELLAKKDEILEKDLLWTRVVGQEQIMK